MLITDFNIVYLNLDHRIDKKNHIEKELKKNKIKAKRVSAIYGKKLLDPELRCEKYVDKISKELNIDKKKLTLEYWKNRSNFKTMTTNNNTLFGKVGCFLSHIKLIKYAIDNNCNNILILEDDIRFLSNINSSFDIPEDSDITYFGGLFFWQTPNNKNYLNENINNDWIKINTNNLKIVCTVAYSINTKKKIKEIYKILISTFINSKKAFDKNDLWRSGEIRLRATAIDFMYINFFQKLGNCYIKNPVMTIHDNKIGSDISSIINKAGKKKYPHLRFLIEEHKKKYLSFV